MRRPHAYWARSSLLALALPVVLVAGILVPATGARADTPQVTVDPLVYGHVPIGDRFETNLIFHNNGPGALDISSIELIFPFSSADFSFGEFVFCSGVSGSSLAEGGSCRLPTTFAPSVADHYQGTLTIDPDGPDGSGPTGTGSVQAEGTPYKFAPSAGGGSCPSSALGQGYSLCYDFGAVAVGSTVSATFTVSDVVDGTGAVTSTGPEAPFSKSDAGIPFCSLPCTVTVSFSPTTAGSFASSFSYGETSVCTVNPDGTRTCRAFKSNPLRVTGTGIDPPTVTTNPSDVTVQAGETASFTASATGGTPTVQWEKSTDGGSSFSPISGATSTTYSFVAGIADNGSKYRAVFTNTAGSATSSAATLTVTRPPNDNFANAQVFSGSTGSVAGSNIAATTETGERLLLDSSASVWYSWTAPSSGDVWFDTCQTPLDTVLGAWTGASVTQLNLWATDDDGCGVVSGGSRMGFAATGGTTYYISVAGYNPGDESTFTLAWSQTPDVAPVVTTHAVDITVTEGETASFSAAASGAPAPTVRWEYSDDGGATFFDSGVTAATFSFKARRQEDGLKVRAVFQNRAGSATSTATLTVRSAPLITRQPANLTRLAGQTATFVATATGNPSPTVQWAKSTDGGSTWNDIAGATSTTLSFTAAAGDNGSMYHATFTNSLGSATTREATLTVNVPPSITMNPASSTVNAGQTATFTAVASGQPSPTVQWQKSTDGGGTYSDIPSATSTTLSFVAAASDDGSRYRAIFTNAAGSATTTAATLTVHSPPAITSGNATTFTYSAPGSFTVTTTGNPKPSLSTSGSLPSGVTFTDNGNGTATLAGTPASGTAGSYSLTITASNSVSPNATQSFTLTVEKAGTTTSAVTSSANPSIVGQAVTFSATVAKVAPATATPAGTVDFYDGATKIGSGTLNASGVATFQTSALAVGSHLIIARYLGNGDFGASQSASALTQNVTYGIRLLYGPRARYTSGSTIPIKVSLINFAGQNISTASQVLTVNGVTPSPGVAGPTGTFAFSSRLDKTGGYQYDLKTTGYAKGSYKLLFTVSGDPITHEAPFVIG